MPTELIFVSYSSKDRPFAIGLTKELQKLGANIWIDQLGIKLGENWDNAIENALDDSETFMLILSPTSVASQNVQDEVSIAISENKKLVPILIKPCDLPMRWKRRQYADLTTDPDKALSDVLQFLGLEDEAAENLKSLMTLIDASKSNQKENLSASAEQVEQPKGQETALEALLVSEEEIDRAALMHKRGIKKNWQMIALVGVVSLVLLGIGYMTDVLPIPDWMAIVAGLSVNLLSIMPYSGIRKRTRNIALFDLLKINRARLTRVINKITEKEIEDFNNKFDEYITV